MDRTCAQPLDLPAIVRMAHISPAHFSRLDPDLAALCIKRGDQDAS